MKMTEISKDSPQQSQAARQPFCVWLVDDHESVLDLASELIGKDERLDCARKFDSAEAVLEAMSCETAPDIILTDVNMGGMSGIKSIPHIKSLAPATRVFIMTTFYDSQLVSCAQSEGAAGFFLKSGDWEETIERLANPSADWKTESPVPVPVQWETKETDFEPAVRGSGLRSNSAASKPKRTDTIAAQQEQTPLLERAVALMRALVGRRACAERSMPQ